MPLKSSTIMNLDVPVVVRLAERLMTTGDVMRLVPGSIIEMPKKAEDELDLLINNRQIGSGTAVKVGENFGLRVSTIESARSRLKAAAEAAQA
jgi:flagellar motor switch protein FliN